MEQQHTLDSDFLNFIVEWIKLFSKDKDKATTYVGVYMNHHRNVDGIYVRLLSFLKWSPYDVSQFLAGKGKDKDLKIYPYEKTELDIDIISNISSSTASKWLPELNSINLLKVIDDKKFKSVNIFLFTFLLRGLRNNNFLNAVKRNIHNLNLNIIKLLKRLIIAIKITYSNESALTDKLMKSELMSKLDVELVKKLFKKANSPYLIHIVELNKIKKMQEKLDKLLKILNNKEVPDISFQSNSSSYKVLDKEKFDPYTMLEHLMKFDDTVASLIKRKDLELKEYKDNEKEFSLREFNKYLYSDKDKYFIRKYKNICYRFTPDNFYAIYNDVRV
jgi:hypothetical protein